MIESITIEVMKVVLYEFIKIGKEIKISNEYKRTFDQSFKGSEIDNEIFCDFISLNMVTDEIISFLKFRNTLKYEVRKKNKARSQNADIDNYPLVGTNIPLTRSKLIEKLSKAACNYFELKKIQLNIKIVNSYFVCLFASIEDLIMNDLPVEMEGVHYVVRIYLENYLKGLNQSIDFLLKSKIEINNNTIDEYLKYSKSRYEKFNVYGIPQKMQLREFYIPPKLSIFNKYAVSNDDKRTGIEWNNLFQFSNLVSVVGGPGYGKTLFMKYLYSNYDKLRVSSPDIKIPIYCNIKAFIDYASAYDHSIEGFIQYCMVNNSGLSKEKISITLINDIINDGRMILLLDALDEIDSTLREELAERLIAYCSELNTNNKIVITTRDRSLIPETDIVYRIHKLDEDDINAYIQKMIALKIIDDENSRLFHYQARKLVKTGFLTSHLMLSLMLKIFSCEKRLPETKVKLYKTCTNYITLEREMGPKAKKLDFDYKLMGSLLKNDTAFTILAKNGYPSNKEVDEVNVIATLEEGYSLSYICPNQRLNAIKEFLRFCNDRTELFVAGSREKSYNFFHRSFFDYYYSRYLVQHFFDNNMLYTQLETIDIESEILELVFSILLEENYHERYLPLLKLISSKGFYSNKNTLFIYITALLISREEALIENVFKEIIRDLLLLEMLPVFLIQDFCKAVLDIYGEHEVFQILYDSMYEDLMEYFFYIQYGIESEHTSKVDLFFEILVDKYVHNLQDEIENCEEDYISIKDKKVYVSDLIEL